MARHGNLDPKPSACSILGGAALPGSVTPGLWVGWVGWRRGRTRDQTAQQSPAARKQGLGASQEACRTGMDREQGRGGGRGARAPALLLGGGRGARGGQLWPRSVPPAPAEVEGA